MVTRTNNAAGLIDFIPLGYHDIDLPMVTRIYYDPLNLL